MRTRRNLDTPLAIALAPLLAAQTIWVRSRVLQMPEPDGARDGVTGAGPDLRLLVIGDSSAAGVGVATQDLALTPQLARALGRDWRVNWYVQARNGATTADGPAMLQLLGSAQFDAVLVIFGVNDAKNLRPERAWRRDLAALIGLLRTRHGAPQIFFSGLPRIRDFPLLPDPLRAVLALRAARFDRALQQVALAADCHHLPIDIPLDPAGMALDGFHPGPPIYAQWAEMAAEGMAERLRRIPASPQV